MEIIFFVLLNIFVAIKSRSILEGKVDGEILPSGTISHAASIIYYRGPSRMERVFTGVMIAELHVLTIGHEARSIEQTFFGNSNIHVYDAWVAIGIDAYTVDASVAISTTPNIYSKRIRVIDVCLLQNHLRKHSRFNIAVLTFHDPIKCFWATPIKHDVGNRIIEGEAYYDVQELIRPVGERVIGVIKRKSLTIFQKDDCSVLYGINITDSHFCGKAEDGFTFSEAEEGAGLIQYEKVIGVATHSQVGQWAGKFVEIIVFVKVGLYSDFIFKAIARGKDKSMSITKYKLSEIFFTYNNRISQARS